MINSPSRLRHCRPSGVAYSRRKCALLYIYPRHGAIVRIFDTVVANCEHARNLLVTIENTAEIRRGHARRIIGRMMLIGLVLFAMCAGSAVSQLPPGVTSCPRTNNPSEYNKCVLTQLQALTPYLAKGVPSLKLPALDPLFLPSLTIDRNLESLKIKANMSQIRVYGGTNYIVQDLKANPNDLTISIKARMPHMYVVGDYDVQGRLLLLPLNGAGNFKGNFTDTEAQVNAQAKETIDKNGVQRLEIDKLVAKIRVGNGKITLKSPPTHTLTADAAATFFNSNPRLVLDIASPIIEDTAATVSKALATRALSVLTKQELVP